MNAVGKKGWNPRLAIYALLATLIVALYAILTFVTPLYIDDWMFMSNWKEHSGSDGFSFLGWWNYYEFTRGFDNGRLSNAFAVFTSLFSPFKEIFPLLNGIVVFLLILLCQRIVCFGTRSDNLVWLCVCWFCCLVFLPWTPLFVADYSLNYIWGGCVTLGFLYFILIREKKGWNPLTLATGILFSAVAGGWHESFAIESICGLGLVILVKNRKLSRNFYVIFLAYLLFTFCFGWSQGMKNRFEWEFLSTFKLPNMRVFLIWICILLAVIFMMVDRKIRKQSWNILKSPVSLCCVGIGISGYVIAILTRNEARSFFWPNMGLVILLLYMARHSALIAKVRVYKRYLLALVSILPLFCTVQLICTIRLQERYRNFWNDIYGELKQSENGIVYYNPELFAGDNNVSKYILIRPVGTYLSNEWQNQALWMFFRTPFLSIVPEQMKEMESRSMKPIDGNLEGKIVNGFLVSGFSSGNPDGTLLPSRINLEVTNKKGETIRYDALASPFVPCIDGIGRDTMVYIDLPDLDKETIERIDTVR